MQALALIDEMAYAGALLVLKRLVWRDNALRECSSCCPHETLWIDLDYALTRCGVSVSCTTESGTCLPSFNCTEKRQYTWNLYDHTGIS